MNIPAHSGGLVFSMEEVSTFNGPGIRTTVFLSGCPLRCKWCHNPEGQTLSRTILRSPNGCSHCGNCARFAVDGHFTDASVSHCPNGLLRHSAREYTAAELINSLSSNFELLNSTGGGVTFSGGEPTFQSDFLLDCLRLLRGKTSRAVQTCGYCDEARFAEVVAEADYFLYDLKLAEESSHIRHTGKGNALILRNLNGLCASGVPFVVRVPLIPGVTDTEANLKGISEILASRGISSVELLPYNRATGAKYALLGREYAPGFNEDAAVAPRFAIFRSAGIKAEIK